MPYATPTTSSNTPPVIFGLEFPIAIVVPLTTTCRGPDLHVEASANRDTSLRETSYVQCVLLRSVNAAPLSHRLGAIDAETSWHVSDIVRILPNP